MKILQFTPYYSPHKWWLEIVAQTISQYLVEEQFSEVINVTSSVKQEEYLSIYPKIIYKNSQIWYTIDGYQVIVIPSFEIVHNFPCPKFWQLKFRSILRYLRNQKTDIIQTHTRFFLQTMLGWIVAKVFKKKRVHVEHGSWFVGWYPVYIKFFAWLFDVTVWLWIFRQSDAIITISKTNIPFIKKFTKKHITVIYNPITYVPKKSVHAIIPHIGFVGRLVPLKGVDVLIKALKHIEHMSWTCTIVWDWSQRNSLENLVQEQWLLDRIFFVWSDDRSNWMHKFTILVNPSYQEWLPTTVVEWLLSTCVVVATRVGWTAEISDQKDLILVEKWSISDLQNALEYALQSNEKLQGLSYDLVKERFDGKRSVGKYFEVYKKLI